MRELLKEEINIVSGGMIGKNEAIGSSIAGDVGASVGKGIDNLLSVFKNIKNNGWHSLFEHKPPINPLK
ncbi:hypothetical protein [Serratia proteamaculans]|uniref:Bacteriocin n=1 Tax=Serratia proteamaculans TaxID=28151 RepID=A0A5Q2VDG0_SERPR|nr:hypothetical protein [Serratia proteamaculans]QGH62035.1 hypothetical protein GHV41_14910 [Serratia proteamaculans]